MLRFTCRKLNNKPPPLEGHSIVEHRGELYLFGYADLKGSLCEFWRYSFGGDAWQHLDEAARPESSPSARYKHAGVLRGDTLWMCGGLMGVTDRNLNQTWQFCFRDRRWSQLKNKGASRGVVPAQLFSHALACVHGDVLVFGGKRESGESVSKLWRVRDAFGSAPVNTWTCCGSELTPSATSNHALVVLRAPSAAGDVGGEGVHFVNENAASVASVDENAVSSGFCSEEMPSAADDQGGAVPAVVVSDVYGGDDTTNEKLSLLPGGAAKMNYRDYKSFYARDNMQDVLDGEDSDGEGEVAAGDANGAAAAGLYTVQTVNHYSYNLSPYQQKWECSQVSKTAAAETLETTSFIDLPEDVSPQLVVSDSEDSALPTLPLREGAFYRNSNAAAAAEARHEAPMLPKNGGDCFRRTASLHDQYKLLLVGCNVNQSDFHKDESVHMWECDLLYY